jgi:hypothetical protein
MKTRTKAKSPTTAATIARALSTTLREEAMGTGRDTGAGRGATAGAAAGARPATVAAGAGVEVAATGAAGAGVAAATAAGEGILIVGAAVGLGGRLIRTVSFFGCTLADSEGLGGAAPGGTCGIFSAITSFVLLAQTRFHPSECQMHIQARAAQKAVRPGCFFFF